MKTLTTLFALALFCATAYGQTIKSLGFNTTNGEVVANTGTNTLTFTNDVEFNIVNATALRWDTNIVFGIDEANFFVAPDFDSPTIAAETRTNLGLYNTNEASSFAALALWDEANEQVAFRVVDDELRVPAYLAVTNAPTNTTNAARWIQIVAGENLYFIPLFQ
jgi:hypothetical protein